jgi:hypothetical protein
MRIELNIDQDAAGRHTVFVNNPNHPQPQNRHRDAHNIPSTQLPIHTPYTAAIPTLYPVDPKLDIGAKPWVKPPASPLTFISK